MIKIIIVGFVLLLVWLAYLTAKTITLTSQLEKQKQHTEEQRLGLLNEIEYQKSVRRPAILAKENQVAIPELGITLPYNEVTKTLQYTTDVETRITSDLISDRQLRQLSCSDLVRITYKDGNPYSPWEEAAGSVKLANGKTLYIIAAKAFKNNEASSEECATEVWTRITPQQVANEFKKAQSY